MIGSITLPSGTQATLNDEGVWETPDGNTPMEKMLRLFFNPADPDRYSYPSCGVFGRAAVIDAAKFFKVKPELAPEPPPLGEDVVS